MAGAGKGVGKASGIGRLESNIYCIKYTLFCFNVVMWMFGVAIFALSLWICVDPGFNEFARALEIGKYFIGIYILILMSLVTMIVSFLGCGSALMENVTLLFGYIGTQLFLFVVGLVASSVLLAYSTYDSAIQPIIKESVLKLINNPHHENSKITLRMIQEGVGCCGADGPSDYYNLQKPLPSECRDSVTGNAYFHGCVDEMTWYLESKSGWLSAIALAACMIYIVNAVMSLVLIQAVKKEEEEVSTYKQ